MSRNAGMFQSSFLKANDEGELKIEHNRTDA